MPQKLHQPELAKLPIFLEQPQDLLPRMRSPLLGDSNAHESLKALPPLGAS